MLNHFRTNSYFSALCVCTLTTYSSSRSNIVTNKRQTRRIDKMMDSKSFTMYPNPANKEIHIIFSKAATKESVVEIIDVNGHILEKKLMNSDELSLNVESLKSGIYIVSIKTDRELFHQKLVKR